METPKGSILHVYVLGGLEIKPKARHLLSMHFTLELSPKGGI
jgi:hypothetical protein